MPPKKAAPVPATVTTSRGKEYETTAAAARPKRERTAVNDAVPVTAAASSTGKKRGRPAKEEAEATEPPKKRGRPAKAASPPAKPAAAKRGRPAKSSQATPATPATRKPDRPPKSASKRGRRVQPKETLKSEVAEEAAAEQLEGELDDATTAEPSKHTPFAKRGSGRPPKATNRGKKAAKNEEDQEEERDADEDSEAADPSSSKSYWLMKAEQEDREETLKDGTIFNARFTIDDLRNKNGPEPWDGVRNPTACKNMKAMKLGDEAFFYASGGKKGRVPGITGIMEIVQEAEPDLSAFDEDSPFYVESDKMRGTEAKPRWFMVHVEHRKKLIKPVTLSELKKFAEPDRVLSQMQEFTAARLSVSKVTKTEWDFIVNELIEGYEEDMPTNVDGIEANRVEIAKTKEQADEQGEIPDSDMTFGVDGAADEVTAGANGTS